MSDERLNMVLRHHSGGERLRRWLKHLWNTNFHHGSALIDLYGQEPSVVDAVARVDDLLRTLRDAGWIVQGKKCPTLSQAAFDLDGARRGDKTGFYGSWYGYEPNRESAGLRQYIGIEPAAAAATAS